MNLPILFAWLQFSPSGEYFFILILYWIFVIIPIGFATFIIFTTSWFLNKKVYHIDLSYSNVLLGTWMVITLLGIVGAFLMLEDKLGRVYWSVGWWLHYAAILLGARLAMDWFSRFKTRVFFDVNLVLFLIGFIEVIVFTKYFT